MCHFLSFTTFDRDQEETRLAMEAFQRLIQAYPQSEYSLKAKKQLFECQKRIVAHEFYVGRLYYTMGEFYSAKDRLGAISRNYPEAVRDLGYNEEIDKMLAVCERRLAAGGKKPSAWSRMGF
jgi:outer membrane protein assembly factor BamD